MRLNSLFVSMFGGTPKNLKEESSRNEATARRDAGSMASRRSVSFPSGNHGYMRNLRRSLPGTRAASKC